MFAGDKTSVNICKIILRILRCCFFGTRNFSFFVRSNCIFVSGYIINVDTHHESFNSKKKPSNKKVIAKKPLTNLYEMNSKRNMPVKQGGNIYQGLTIPDAALQS